MGILSRNLVYWGGCITAHHLLAKFVYRKGMEINLLDKEPLYDIVQVYSPNLQPYRMIPEILHLIPIILLAIYTLLYRHKRCLDDFCFKHGTLMLIRGICFSSTLLPDSSQMCSLSNHFGGCFDLLFSGHSTIMFLSTLLLIQYFPSFSRYKILLHGNVSLTCILIILCRNHYTIDVVISVILTYLIWKK